MSFSVCRKTALSKCSISILLTLSSKCRCFSVLQYPQHMGGEHQKRKLLHSTCIPDKTTPGNTDAADPSNQCAKQRNLRALHMLHGFLHLKFNWADRGPYHTIAMVHMQTQNQNPPTSCQTENHTDVQAWFTLPTLSSLAKPLLVSDSWYNLHISINCKTAELGHRQLIESFLLVVTLDRDSPK